MEIKKNLTTILILLILFSIVNNVSATIYRSYVDQDYGFYRVIVLTDNTTTVTKTISYVNKTLNISVGDTIIWRNDATPDEELNIISDQKLWNGTARLRWNYQTFNYTFNESGIYTFHIEEYPRLQQQKIIVNPIVTPIRTTNVTEMPTIIQTINKTVPNKTSIATSDTPKKTSGFEIVIAIMIILFTYKFGRIK